CARHRPPTYSGSAYIDYLGFW
nr:immunoglobulin heavy chain junction region [Macaca mulatta]MOX95260.1 immunoglobulin heavy chain junction region [Macaca mulatta]